jgi:hypothetical protein
MKPKARRRPGRVGGHAIHSHLTFLKTLYRLFPDCFDDLRNRARQIAADPFGRELAAFQRKWNLTTVEGDPLGSGFWLPIALWRLARTAAESSVWPDFDSIWPHHGDLSRAARELQLVYEFRNRVEFRHRIAARLALLRKTDRVGARELASVLRAKRECLRAIGKRSLNASPEQHAAWGEELFGESSPFKIDIPNDGWSFPRNPHPGVVASPIEAVPTLESRDQFRARSDQHWRARARLVKRLGLQLRARRIPDQNFEWLIRFQVGRESYGRIARSVVRSDKPTPEDSRRITVAVCRLAESLGLQRRSLAIHA